MEVRLKKVLHLIDSGGLYGAEQVLLTLCREQRTLGLEPTILSCGLPGEPEKAVELAANEQGITLKSWRMKAGLNLKGVREILVWAKSEGYELLHSHGYKFNILLGLISPRERQLPAVATIHGYVKTPFPSKMWAYEFLDRLLVKRFDRVVLVSEQMRQLPAFRGRAMQRKVTVIRNGVEARTDSGHRDCRNPAKHLLAVGRLSPEKGFDLLIAAMANLIGSDPEYRLTILGEGGLKYPLQEQARELGIADKVTFGGFVPDAHRQFEKYDALVMPSRTEGIPITLLEAARASMPVFASRVGGIPEVLSESSELLINEVSSRAVEDRIRWWNRLAPGHRIHLIRALNGRFRNLFSSGAMAEAYGELYNGLAPEANAGVDAA